MAFGMGKRPRVGGGSRFGAPVGPAGLDEPDTDDMGGPGGMSAAPSDDLSSAISSPASPATAPSLVPPQLPARPAQPKLPHGGRRSIGRGRFPKKMFSAGARHNRPNQFFGE